VEDFVEGITGGNVTAVKIVLTSVVSALALYQVFLMAVGYGKIRLPWLGSGPASKTHRAVGDTVVTITLLVGFMCLAYFGIDEGGSHGASDADETRAAIHVVAGTLLVAVLALKISVLRWWHSLSRFLPVLGISVFLLFSVTWLTSAAEFLGVW
jgi:hypothetical protein